MFQSSRVAVTRLARVTSIFLSKASGQVVQVARVTFFKQAPLALQELHTPKGTELQLELSLNITFIVHHIQASYICIFQKET